MRPEHGAGLDHWRLDPGIGRQPPRKAGQHIERARGRRGPGAASPAGGGGPPARKRGRGRRAAPRRARARPPSRPARRAPSSEDLGLDEEGVERCKEPPRRSARSPPPSRGRAPPAPAPRPVEQPGEGRQRQKQHQGPADRRLRQRRRRRSPAARAVRRAPATAAKRSGQAGHGRRPIRRRQRRLRRTRRASRTRRRSILRASASSTSNAVPSGWAITSPRTGTRPARRKTRPPSVSTSSASVGVGEPHPGHRLEVLEVHPPLDEVDAGRLLGPQVALGLVVLVGDVADDLLEQVLEGDEAVDAAVFVDDQRHVDVRGLHPLEQDPDRHRRRRVDQRPEQSPEVEGRGPATPKP